MSVDRSGIAVFRAYWMSVVDRPACPSLEVGVGGIPVGVRKIVDESSSWIDRVDLEAAGCD
jgi:hypothetical protein